MTDPAVSALSRDAILDAAETLFARQGYDATTVKEIALAAGVNVALLYYYFGDKEALYHAVLERVVQQFVARVVAAFKAPASPADAVSTLIRFQATALAEQPAMARLMVREMLDHDAEHARPQLTTLAANLFRRLCETIERGQKDGSFRADLDPRFAAISSIAQMVHFTLARPAVHILLGDGADDPMLADRFAEHAAGFALSALAARDGSSLTQADGA